MATIGNNFSGRISNIRDRFLNALDQDFLTDVLSNKHSQKKLDAYANLTVDEIMQRVKFIDDALLLGAYKNKYGEVIVLDEKEIKRLEKIQTMLLSSIEDAELVLTLEPDV